jgi:hypothetical protein
MIATGNHFEDFENAAHTLVRGALEGSGLEVAVGSGVTVEELMVMIWLLKAELLVEV